MHVPPLRDAHETALMGPVTRPGERGGAHSGEPPSNGSHDEREREVQRLRARVQELERQLNLRDEFIAAVGHELRNPISPVLLHVHRLIARARNGGGASVSSVWLIEQLESFIRRVDRFVAVLDRLLDASRIGAGQIDLVVERVDLAELVRDVVANSERELAAARSVVTLSGEQSLVGDWDRLRLEQIVANLLSNAIRYGAGAPIELSLQLEQGWAVLRVIDHGIGIPPEHQARIFERFERAGAAQRRGGFGIGLWVVREVSSALGGSVSVDSQPGAGSTFTVRIPCSLRRSAAP